MVTASSKFHRLTLVLATTVPLTFFAASCSSSDSDGTPPAPSGDAGSDAPNQTRPEPKYRLSTGADTVCVTSTDGALRCWGDNGGGQLGLGTWDHDLHPQPTNAVPGVVATQVAAGDQICAVTDNDVKCWGANNRGGQTGQPSENTTEKCNDDGPLALPCTKTPSVVAGANGAVRLAVGGGFSCAQTSKGVVCWGGDTSGILGRKDALPFYDNPPLPISFDKPEDISTLVAGKEFACVRKGNEGSVWCWGGTGFGQIGVAAGAPATPTWNSDRHPTPHQADGLSRTLSLAVGVQHACAVLPDKTVSCWGRNGRMDGDVWIGGQLGHAREKDEECGSGTFKSPCTGRPSRVEGIQNARELALGEQHSCAVLEDDTVVCWGNPSNGRIGLAKDVVGKSESHPEPVKIPELTNVAHIVAGNSYTCAVTWDSKVSCWGVSLYGVVGGKASSHLPKPVPGLQ